MLGAGASGLETRSTEKTPGGEARGRRGGGEGALLPLPPLTGDGGVWDEWAAAPGGEHCSPGAAETALRLAPVSLWLLGGDEWPGRWSLTHLETT